MKLLKPCYITTLVISFFITTVQADTPVWRVSKGDKHLFIGGTIHLLSPKDYPLPEAFDAAYKQSKLLVTEADMQKMQDPNYQQKMLSLATYPTGESLKQHLSKTTYQELAQYCANNNLSIDYIMSFKPGMATMLLTVVELNKLGLSSQGVDAFFSSLAITDKKERLFLETADEQIIFMSEMGQGREDALVKYTLQEMDQLESKFSAMKKAWRTGNLKTLSKLALKNFEEDFPTIYKTLLVERNNAWMPKIEDMLKTKDVELVLFGALHLVGDSGILKQLKEKGFKVKRLKNKL